MKSKRRLLSSWWWYVLHVLFVIHPERSTAINVYRNNEYEVSQIDRRIVVPRPNDRDHTSIKRQQVILFEDSPRKRKHTITPIRHRTTSTARHEKLLNGRPTDFEEGSLFIAPLSLKQTPDGRKKTLARRQQALARHHQTLDRRQKTLNGRPLIRRHGTSDGRHGTSDGRHEKSASLLREYFDQGQIITPRRQLNVVNVRKPDNVHPKYIEKKSPLITTRRQLTTSKRQQTPLNVLPKAVVGLQKASVRLQKSYIEGQKPSVGLQKASDKRQQKPIHRHSTYFDEGTFIQNKRHRSPRQHIGTKRQDIIHAISDNKNKKDTEDDIESFGRPIDEMGDEIRKPKPEPVTEPVSMSDTHIAGATRYIISKIKEIQDKLFKRTGTMPQELEDKLNQMDPSKKDETNKTEKVVAKGEPTVANKTIKMAEKQETTSPSTNITKAAPVVAKVTTDVVKVTPVVAKVTTEVAKVTPDVAKASPDVAKVTPDAPKTSVEAPSPDGSHIGDRRKIIPEEVVDKILEKFQQLKTEAKHIVNENRNSVGHAEAVRKEPKEEMNPYATIGKQRNHTKDVPTIDNTKDIQIPLGSLATGKDGKPPAPIMFIKNGDNLVPVYSSTNAIPKQTSASPEMSFAEDARARFDGNSGIAEQRGPLYEAQMNNDPQGGNSFGTTIADHMLDKLNINSGVADPNQMPATVPFANFGKMPEPKPSVDNNFERFKKENELEMSSMYTGNNPMDTASTTRCAIPNCNDPASQLQSLIRDNFHDSYQNHHTGTIPGVPSTEDIIQSVLKSPDFPTVAAHILHNSINSKAPARKSNDFLPPSGYGGNRPEYEQNEDGRDPSQQSDDNGYPGSTREMEMPGMYREKDDPNRYYHKSREASRDPDLMSQLPSDATNSDPYFQSDGGGRDRNEDKTPAYNDRFGFEGRSSPHPDEVSPKDVHVMSFSDLQKPSRDIQGMNPGLVQFKMQQNLAQNNMGEMSMMGDGKQPEPNLPPEPPALDPGNINPVSEDLQRQMGMEQGGNGGILPQFSPFMGGGSSSLMGVGGGGRYSKGDTRHAIGGSMNQPYGEDVLRKQNPNSLAFKENSDALTINDISDPAPKLPESEQELSQETPDQLLELAKEKTFQQQYQSTLGRFNKEQVEPENPSVPNSGMPNSGMQNAGNSPIPLDSENNMVPDLPPQMMIPPHKSRGKSLLQARSNNPEALLDTIHSQQFNLYPNLQTQTEDHVMGNPKNTMEIPPPQMGMTPQMNSQFERTGEATGSNANPNEIEDIFKFDHSPDVLLEMLRRQKDKNMASYGNHMDASTYSKYKKAKYQEESARSRGEIPSSVDPSLADDIPSMGGQQLEVQSKGIASQNSKGSRFLQKHRIGNLNNNQVSIVPGNLVQYNHGKMSMDSANVVDNFFRDNSFDFRNNIPRPMNYTTGKAMVRASIVHNLPSDGIEIRINGKKPIHNMKMRRSRLLRKDDKLKNPNGETIFSKGAVKIELSHGIGKRKIVNIITQKPYNVTEDDRKRTHIAKNVHD